MTDDEKERLSLPEHKWIVNLQRYYHALQRSRDYCTLCDQEDQDLFKAGNLLAEMMERHQLLEIYKKRITNCSRGNKCKDDECPYFHSIADKKLFKQHKKNKDDYHFYKDKFFQLFELIKPFLIGDVASIVRDYCCVQTFKLTKEGVLGFNLEGLWADLTISSRTLFRWRSSCIVCIGFHRCNAKLLRANSTENEDYYNLHQNCGIKYLGLNRHKLLHGWRFCLVE